MGAQLFTVPMWHRTLLSLRSQDPHWGTCSPDTSEANAAFSYCPIGCLSTCKASGDRRPQVSILATSLQPLGPHKASHWPQWSQGSDGQSACGFQQLHRMTQNSGYGLAHLAATGRVLLCMGSAGVVLTLGESHWACEGGCLSWDSNPGHPARV